MVANVPGGLEPARCLRVDLGERHASVWLETLSDQEGQPWRAARLSMAAQHLGRFQGHFAARGPLPTAPWLPQGWLRQYIEASAPYITWLQSGAAAGHSLAERLWPGPVRDGVLRLWDERQLFLAALDSLPQTLRHGDANPGNLFAVTGAQGEPVTVAIDWALIAQGAIGEDLAALLRGRNRVREHLPADVFRELIVEGYLAGLREGGCHGGADEVQLGHTASAALRDCFHTLAYELLDDARRAAAAARLGKPIEPLFDSVGQRVRAGLERADEARALLGRR
jgi:hypothetical protein